MKKVILHKQLFLMIGFIAPVYAEDLPRIRATIQTDSVSSFGDAADDTAIYAHISDPSKSVIIGTNKASSTGLIVYNLAGKKIQSISDGKMNNVDVRQGKLFSNEHIAIVAAGNRSQNSISVYEINPTTINLKNISSGKLNAGVKVYGSCLYFSKATRKLYFFVNSHSGEVVQWHLKQNAERKIEATEVRRFNVGSQTEGCVADDELGDLYIGEESVGIWKYAAEPNQENERILIDGTAPNGNLKADVEGLTIYKKPNNEGYLLASSQGDDAYVVYDRKTGKFLAKFQIVDSSDKLVRNTDGIDAESENLGTSFANGMLAVQDGYNGVQKQDFKYIPFEAIEKILPAGKGVALE